VIVGDRSRLIQVLTNLLTNAAKYTPVGGDIELVVTQDVARKCLAIHVRDTGIGIPPDMLSRIFEIFVQSRGAQGRSQGGLGVGLNIVRRLVELHGGAVSASSDGPNRGSQFVVELPLL
jgi:signal transduction histidine kinase